MSCFLPVLISFLTGDNSIMIPRNSVSDTHGMLPFTAKPHGGSGDEGGRKVVALLTRGDQSTIGHAIRTPQHASRLNGLAGRPCLSRKRERSSILVLSRLARKVAIEWSRIAKSGQKWKCIPYLVILNEPATSLSPYDKKALAPCSTLLSTNPLSSHPHSTSTRNSLIT
jgi:hypothetical protein